MKLSISRKAEKYACEEIKKKFNKIFDTIDEIKRIDPREIK